MKHLYVFFLASLILFVSNAQKRNIDVSGFSELSFGIPGTVYLKQGSEENVVVDCDDDVFDKIEFEVNGDKLSIRKKGKLSWKNGIRNSELNIYITMINVEAISLSGSGKIEGDNQINTEDLKLSVSGSGGIDLDVDGDELEIRISGSGDVDLKGTSQRVNARISGSGKVNAQDMNTQVFKASVSGSGNCYITATDEIDAKISGSGNIYYSGDPKKVYSDSSGSGKVRKQ